MIGLVDVSWELGPVVWCVTRMSLLETSRRPASKREKTRRNAGPASSFLFFLGLRLCLFLPSPLSPLFQAGKIPVACLALAPTCGLHAPASVRMRIRNIATRNFADWAQATIFTSLGDQCFFMQVLKGAWSFIAHR